MSEIVSNLEFRNYEYQDIVIEFYEKDTDIFFIQKGAISLFSKNMSESLLSLEEDSYFGDIPLLLNIHSTLRYKVSVEHSLIFNIQSAIFLSIL